MESKTGRKRWRAHAAILGMAWIGATIAGSLQPFSLSHEARAAALAQAPIEASARATAVVEQTVQPTPSGEASAAPATPEPTDTMGPAASAEPSATAAPSASGTPAPSATPTTPPTPTTTPAPEVKVSLVDFGGNIALIRDRSSRKDDYDPGTHQKITEFAEACKAAKNAIEWRDCTPAWPDGTTEKNWPVAYVMGTKVQLARVDFRVKAQPALTKVTVTGSVELGTAGTDDTDAGKLIFTKSDVSQANDAISITGLTADRNLPSFVTSFTRDRQFTIIWTISYKDKGKDVEIDAGTSRHNLFVLLRRPTTRNLYLTPVDFTTARARGLSAETEVVTAIWREFQGRAVLRRGLDPVSGVIGTDRQPALKYYEPWRTADFFDFNKTCPTPGDTAGLLSLVVGRCGTWGNFLVETLGIHGIAARNNILSAMPGFIALKPPKIIPNSPIKVMMLINHWNFAGPARRLAMPYLTTATRNGNNVTLNLQGVVDAEGVAGQDNANPPGMFVVGDHALVTYANPVSRRTEIYDPSYGSGPYESISAWADDALAGFATLVEAPNGAITLEACRLTTPVGNVFQCGR